MWGGHILLTGGVACPDTPTPPGLSWWGWDPKAMACLSISLHSRKMQVRAKRGGKAGQCLDQGRCRADACLSYTLAWTHTSHCEEKTGPGKQRHWPRSHKVTCSQPCVAPCCLVLGSTGGDRQACGGRRWKRQRGWSDPPPGFSGVTQGSPGAG